MSLMLVTGGAGFIGSNLVDYLLAGGHSVRVLDDFSSGSRDNLAHHDDLEIIEGDVADLTLVRRAVAGVEVIFHHAALPSVTESVNDPLRANTVNVEGTLNVLVAARDADVRRVIYASSSAVYGDDSTQDTPAARVESMLPQPVSPYGAGKMAGETYCRVFHEVYGLETVALRYFNVFGPRQKPDSDYAAVIPAFIVRMLQGQPATIYGDGQQTRDFIFVGDVLRANMLAASAADAPGQVFNVARHEAQTINQLAATLNELMDSDLPPLHADPRPGDIRHSLADVSLAGDMLGFEPQTTLADGLRQTIDWFQKHD